MKWVTRPDVAVDRMACAWLIRRFVDPEAEFLFLPPGQLQLPPAAEPFDIPGVRFAHHGGHSSFHAMVWELRPTDPTLERLARLVDEADMPLEVTLEPAAPGLELICRAIRRIARDDHDAFERSRLIFDALYAELASGSA